MRAQPSPTLLIFKTFLRNNDLAVSGEPVKCTLRCTLQDSGSTVVHLDASDKEPFFVARALVSDRGRPASYWLTLAAATWCHKQGCHGGEIRCGRQYHPQVSEALWTFSPQPKAKLISLSLMSNCAVSVDIFASEVPLCPQFPPLAAVSAVLLLYKS